MSLVRSFSARSRSIVRSTGSVALWPLRKLIAGISAIGTIVGQLFQLVHDRYCELADRLPKPIGWLLTRRLFGYLITIVVIFVAYHNFANRVSPQTDAILFGIVCFVLLECAAGMMLATKEWTIRACGVLSLILGFALIYFLVFARVFNLATWLTEHREYIELVRSFALSTALFLGIAANRYLWENRFRPPAWWKRDQPSKIDDRERPGKFLDV